MTDYRRSPPKVFLGKGVLKICCKFSGEHPCRSLISRKLLFEFILQHGCSPVNLLHNFRNLYLRTPPEGCFCNYPHNNQYYWHLPQVTSIKSNYKMIVCWLLLIITSHLTHLQYVNIECTDLF